MNTQLADIALPQEVETNVEIFDVVGPSFVYAIASDSASIDELLNYADIIAERLADSSAEIKDIEIVPSNEFEISIQYDADALSDKGLQVNEVTSAIQSRLTTLPGGALQQENGSALGITVISSVASISDLTDITVNDVRLDEVATITRRPVEYDSTYFAGYIEDGEAISKEAVYLYVNKQSDGDVIRMDSDLAVVEEMLLDEEVLPQDITLVRVLDNAAYVQRQLEALVTNGIIGLILILVVLMLFINLRTGITVAAIIPLAFLGTLGILYAIGFSINTLTLFGLLLVLGILVDNAIVIAEGIVHELENGKAKMEAVHTAMRNLGPAVTAATLTTITVFIPFAFLGGVIGSFLKYIPYTIIIMLIMSYGLAITVTPLVSRFLMKEQTKEQRRARKLKKWQIITVLPAIIFLAQGGIDKLEDLYGNFSEAIQKRAWKKITLVMLSLGLIGGSVALYGVQLPFQQFPTDDGNTIEIKFEYPTGTSKQTKANAIANIMDDAITTPYFESYFIFEQNSVMMIMVEPEDRAEGNDIYVLQDIANERISDAAKDLLQSGIEVQAEAVGVGPPEADYDVIVELRGDVQYNLNRAASDLASYISEQDAVIKIDNSATSDLTESIVVEFDNEALQDNAIDPLVANSIINQVFGQRTVGTLAVQGDGISDDVVVEFNEDAKHSIDDIRDLIVGVNTSVFPPVEITLDDVAEINNVTGLETIKRLDEKRVITVQARVSNDGDADAITTLVKEYLTDEHLAEYSLDADNIVYGGATASQDENFNNLGVVFLLAILAVYLILIYQFNSYVQPGLILFTVPLALIGVFPALTWVGSSLDMISGLGIVALVGIVVNDAIVFVDYFNRLRKKHSTWKIEKIIVETGRARFKPILSTSITTIFGILPLTLNDPFWRGLGTSLIAGLTFSTLGTLIVFPILLSWNDTIMRGISRCWKFCKCKVIKKSA